MKKNIIIAVLATVVAFFMLLLVVGLTTKEEVSNTEIQYDAVTMETFKDSFMIGCMEDGWIEYKTCECMYNSLLNQLGEEGLIDLSLEVLETGEIPKAISSKMLNECLL